MCFFLLPFLLLLIIWGVLGFLLSNKIFKPKIFSIETVLKNPELRENWFISNKENPGDFGFEFKEVKFKSHRPGSPVLRGWFVPGSGNEAIVMVHGRWSNRLKPLQYLEILKKQARPILIFDLAGSGDSDFSPSTMGILESRDLDGALNFLRTKSLKSFIVYAFSMGGAASVLSASRNKDVNKLVLDSSFASGKTVIIENAKKMGYPAWLTRIGFWFFTKRLKVPIDYLNIVNWLKNLTIPVLVLHSKKDLYTPFHHAKSLNEAGKHIILKPFESGEHVRVYFEHPMEYEKALLDFINGSDK